MFIWFTGHSTSKGKAKAGTNVMDLKVRTETKAMGEHGRTSTHWWNCPQPSCKKIPSQTYLLAILILLLL